MKKFPLGQFSARLFSILTIVFILASCELMPASANPDVFGAPVSPSTDAAAQLPAVTQAVPPELPPVFQTPLLHPRDIPRTYIEETCRYLRNRWNPLNAEPGTVVMIVLIKNINRGTAELPDSISLGEFMELMSQLKAQGFEAIDMRQFQAFMERNVRIPSRSVLIIQSGNYDAEYFVKTFGEYFDAWGWPVVNGWVNSPDAAESLIRENIELEQMGFVDHQANGVMTDTRLTDESAKTVIARELQGSVDGLAEYFIKNPIAIIWPNGGFGIRPVEAARQLRFKLGITSNPRGPVMYNWVPLADSADPDRPTLIPEGGINDPLMTLPSYSPEQALAAIDIVRAIGKAAAEYAQANKGLEHQYYDIVCEDEYGPMPTP
jgi:hypothetical protein